MVNPTDKDMANLYKNCFAILATSFNEDWGMAPLEANSFGKPVLAVNRGGFLESQKNGRTGYLIEDNPNAFASKMNYLTKNKNTAIKMGKKSRRNSKIYSWDNYIKALDSKIYEISSKK
jgi:glycosyltransferase involved in cell wall biosynthesis